jgi:glyoxylase-like metal-dependent hydrolase (beta-lactamase superfamily II)
MRDRLMLWWLALALVACGEDSPGGGAPSAGAGAHGAGAASAGSSQGAGAAGGSASASSGAQGGAATTGSGGSAGAANNGFPDSWPDGTSCGSEPEITVWEYDADTFILRQSLCTHFEGPFLYLLFGQERVLLQDTGTGAVDVQGAVASVIDEWLAKSGKASIELVVTHSHGHGDHVGGDAQFAGQPSTQLVGPSVDSVQAFFGIGQWPTELVEYDLGGRVIDVIPIPGHQGAHVALYDRNDDLLFTGDTLYPGRLYVSSWSSYRESIPRLVDFVEAGNPVSWVLGTHIEMSTTAGDDYPMGADEHPGEHALQLDYSVLLELEQAVNAMGASPEYEPHADFIIYPL